MIQNNSSNIIKKQGLPIFYSVRTSFEEHFDTDVEYKKNGKNQNRDKKEILLNDASNEFEKLGFPKQKVLKDSRQKSFNSNMEKIGNSKSVIQMISITNIQKDDKLKFNTEFLQF